MSDLEISNQVVLTSLVAGDKDMEFIHPMVFDDLATWAYKTSLVADREHDPKSLTRQLHLDFYEERRPKSFTQVWIGANAHLGMTRLDHRLLTAATLDPSGDSHDVKSFATTICVGHLVFYVFARESCEQRPIEFAGRFASAMFPVFPNVSDLIEWPPPLVFDGHSDLAALAAFVGGPLAEDS